METEPIKTEPKRKRRRSQFSLRTLLIGVALLAGVCGYVANEARSARERQNFIDNENPVAADPSGADDVSWIRRLFGDEGYKRIGISRDSDKAKRQRIATLFPEAQIMICTLQRHPEISLDFFSTEYEPFPDDSPSALQFSSPSDP